MLTPAPGDARRLEALLAGAGAVLLAIRPLLWDGEPFPPGGAIWSSLACIVVLAAALRILLLGAPLRWGWAATATAALALALAVAAARAPALGYGLGLWLPLAVHLAFAAALAQAMPGRAPLLTAALFAGLGGEALVALVQYHHVLPAMRASLDAGSLPTEGLPAEDFRERIANGGVYGTFTLSNTLGAFVILLLPAAAAAAVAALRQRRRALGAVLGALALAGGATLAVTGAKGAWLALAAATALALVVLAPRAVPRWPAGRARLLAAGALAAAAALAIVVLAHRPGLASSLQASADVRIGYWSGALRLIGERPLAGHGLGAFAYEFPRVARPADEPARLAHSEPLEAAVSGGVLAGALLATLLALLVAGRWLKPDLAADPAPEPARIPAWTLVAGCTVLSGLIAADGGMAGNLGWWPWWPEHVMLGPFPMAQIVWGLALGAAVGALLSVISRTPAAPPWAWRTGLAALALHAWIDFDLHHGAIWLALAGAALLAGGGRMHQPGRWTRLGATVVLATVILAALAMAWIGPVLANARATVQLASEAVAKRTPAAWAAAAEAADVPPPRAGAQQLAILIALAERVRTAAWLDPEAWTRTVGLLPPGPERLPWSEDATARLPASALARRLHAEDLARAGRWPEALAQGRAAVARAPCALDLQAWLAALLDRAPSTLGGGPDSAEAAALRRAIAAVRDRTHGRWRGRQ
jgi:hypothetical protein